MRRELRTCPISGVTVLLNSAWVGDPPVAEPPPANCWFCAEAAGRGNAPVIADGDGVRAIPHPTPALGIEGDARIRREGVRIWRDAVGAHELVFGEHAGETSKALSLGASRVADLRNDSRMRGFRVFRRAIVGHHAVWQIVALPFDVAPSACASWREDEIRAGVRVAGRAGDADGGAGAIALAAYAPRSPFEVWVMPAVGRGDFRTGAEYLAVSSLADSMVARISTALRGAAVDMIVEDGEPWRIVLLPRVSHSSAIEQATGIATHGAFPEDTASWLR